VEITMAIGIVSFAFVAVLGLLPSGLTTFRKAMDASVSSQIFQRVINEAQQTDFSTLVATPLPVVAYFDDQGNKLDPANKAKAIYHVKTRVTISTPLPGSSTPNTDLATVAIQIANNPGNVDLNSSILETNPRSSLHDLWKMNTGIAVAMQSTMVSRNTSLK